jgi:hypothetical protein
MTGMDNLEPVPFDSGRWQFHAAESRVEEHLGRRSLRLGAGIATVAGLQFVDGLIEFDVAFTGDRGFMGGIWRVQDPGNYEEFYLRPHQSGNPDATQYTPVWNGVSGWQLYHGKRYSVPVVHRPNAWTRVRVLFAGSQAEIYVDDQEEAVLLVEELKRPVAAGGVGVSVGNFATAHFSNFCCGATAAPPFKPRAHLRRPPETAPPGVVPVWWISDAFPESALDGAVRLDGGVREVAAERRWTRLAAERSGLANLARVQGIAPPDNTVFARQVIVAEREATRELRFGWSDRIRVYLNGRLLFRGDDTTRSRDYRFLGSIGYFDALYIPLARGQNELLMAVSEDQGGWGLQAALADRAGIALMD